MIRLGLTGSIGMGKSTVATMFRDRGIPVYDADAAVHALYASGGAAVAPIEAAFPGTTGPQGVDREKLSARVLGNKTAIQQLEEIVHPLVQESRQRFFAQAADRGDWLAIADIPLLYEGNGDTAFDYTVVVSAPEAVQRRRVLARPGMSEEKFTAILSRQIPDAEKRRRADFIIDTGCSLDETAKQVDDLLERLRRMGGTDQSPQRGSKENGDA